MNAIRLGKAYRLETMVTSENSLLINYVVFPLALPLLIGTLVLVAFWKDRVSRLAGFFTLKPVITYPMFLMFSISNYYSVKSFGELLFPLLPAIGLTLLIVFAFRDLFRKSWIAGLFLAFDIFRWANTLVLNYLESQLFDWMMYIGLIFPSLYALLALIVAVVRHIQRFEGRNKEGDQ
jgi:hypothetical protein